MLKTLMKVRLLAFLAQLSAGKTDKTGKPKRRGVGGIVLLCVLFVYCFGVYFAMFLGFFSVLGNACAQSRYLWLYYATAGLIAAFLSVFGSVFSTQSQLFDAKDNELLLSMPIKPRNILLSRLLFVTLLNLLFCVLVMLPCGIVALSFGGVSALGVVLFVLSAVLVTLLSTAICALLGWLISLLTRRVRNKGIVNTVLSLVFLGVFFLLYFQFQKLMLGENAAATIAEKVPMVADAFNKYLIPLRWLGQSVCGDAVWQFAPFTGVVLALFALVVALLVRSFTHITLASTGAKKLRYTKKSLKVGSVRGALLRKELARFTSSSVYMMNCALGLVFILIAAVVLLIKGGDWLTMLPMNLAPYYPLLGTLILSFLGFMNDMTAPSVSLEGKSLWISQLLPMDMSAVLFAKVDMQLVLCAPVLLFASAAFAIVLKVDLVGTLLLLALPQLMNLLNALFGLMMNLAFPRFDWTNEIVPVKQGVSLIITLLATMAYATIPALVYFILLSTFVSATAFLAIYAALTAVLSLLCWLYLKGKGARKFATIG